MRAEQVNPTQNENQATTDSFGNHTSHLKDETLAGSMPKRTWSEWGQEVIRDVGFKAAMGVSSLGLGGAAVTEKQAEAGLMSSFGNDADFRARGATYSVEGGGNAAALRLQSDTQVVHSSLVFVNPYTAIATAHQFAPNFGANPTYSVHTGANYNSGNSYVPSEIIIHPNPAIDFAVLKFATPVPLAHDLVFASARPSQDETVWMAGYGSRGTRETGLLGQDGFIRAGTSFAYPGESPLLGGDPAYYMNLAFFNRSHLPTQMRITYGHSGNLQVNAAGELFGLGRGAGATVNGGTSEILNVLHPDIQGFLGVPEPTSLALVGVAASCAVFSRRRRL